MSETQKSILLEPELLAMDWKKRTTPLVKKACSKTKSIAFVGTGSSYHVALWAHWLCQNYTKGKTPSRAITTWDFLAGDRWTTGQRDTLTVLISHRGNQGLTEKALALLKKSKRVLISAQGSPSGGHPIIETSPQETSQAHTMSLVGAMSASSEILALTLPKIGNKLRRDRKHAAQLFSEALHNLQTPALGRLLSKKAGVYFVGGGPFYAIALELALKVREILHLPAQGFNVEEFLHGPLAALESHDTLIGLPPFKPGTGLEKLLHWNRLSAAHSSVEAIGGLLLSPYYDKEFAKNTASLSPSWQALIHLLWGQLVCLETARAWGIDPDTNRREDPRYDEAFRRTKLG